MLLIGLILFLIGLLLVYAGVKGTDPRDELRKAFGK